MHPQSGAPIHPVKTLDLPFHNRGSAIPAGLIVVSVIVLLLALANGAWNFAKEKTAQLKDVALHSKVLFALETHFLAKKFNPSPAHPEATVQINGVTYSSGGSAMLYQLLTGDGNDQIAETGAGGVPSDGNSENDDPERVLTDVDAINRIFHNGHWLLVDSFGHPIQYQKGGTSDVLNPNFDTWCYGGDTRFTQQHDAASKRDPSVTSNWIRNFSLPPSKRDDER